MSSVNLSSFIDMLRLGCNNIAKNYEYINQLNVFPVPDGDTGTNMKVTITEAIKKLENEKSHIKSFSELGKNFTRDLLLFSRGNSGVIFSQIMKGFFSNIIVNKTSNNSELSIEDVANAFIVAQEVAYKNVSKPVEGTMLTVARLISNEFKSQKNRPKTLEKLFEQAVKVAWQAVKKTPQMLPVLKASGVVDSGAYGFACFLEGMLSYYGGESNLDDNTLSTIEIKFNKFKEQHANEDEFGYCTEYVLRLGLKINQTVEKQKFHQKKFESKVNRIANSVVIASDKDNGFVKVHAHTLKPHLLLEMGLNYGEFEFVKIDNMNLQVNNKNNSPTKRVLKPAIVATVPTEAFAERIREDHDINAILCTDDTGAPSVFSLLEAVKLTNSSNVIFLLHDKNYFLSANETIKQLKHQKINADYVITANPVESIAALTVFNSDLSIHTNVKAMKRFIKEFASATITQASKSYKENKVMVNKNDFIAVTNKSIIASESQLTDCFFKTIDILSKKVKKPEFFLAYYGKDITEQDAKKMQALVEKKYKLFCEFSPGEQKVFSYIMGIQ